MRREFTPFLTLLGIHPLKRSVCKLNSHTWSSSITKIWEALTEWTRIFQTIELQCEIKSGIFAWFSICLIFPSTMHGDCKRLVMKIRWIYYTFEDTLPGLTCLSMPSRLLKDCEGDLNKLSLIFVMMVITTGLYLKSSKPAALIAMQKPLQDVKNVISDFM